MRWPPANTKSLSFHYKTVKFELFSNKKGLTSHLHYFQTKEGIPVICIIFKQRKAYQSFALFSNKRRHTLALFSNKKRNINKLYFICCSSSCTVTIRSDLLLHLLWQEMLPQWSHHAIAFAILTVLHAAQENVYSIVVSTTNSINFCCDGISMWEWSGLMFNHADKSSFSQAFAHASVWNCNMFYLKLDHLCHQTKQMRSYLVNLWTSLSQFSISCHLC